MELTPQQIDDIRTQAEIERKVKASFVTMPHEATEKLALSQHPPVFRQTQPVPPLIRNVQSQITKAAPPHSPSPGGEGRGEGGRKEQPPAPPPTTQPAINPAAPAPKGDVKEIPQPLKKNKIAGSVGGRQPKRKRHILP